MSVRDSDYLDMATLNYNILHNFLKANYVAKDVYDVIIKNIIKKTRKKMTVARALTMGIGATSGAQAANLKVPRYRVSF